MSKMRYDWWSYVKGMIRRYPDLKKRYAELRRVSLSAPVTGMPRGGRISKPTENAALRELSPTNQREYDAVRRALLTTERSKNGAERIQLVQLVFWNGYTISQAAYKLHYGERTAREWHRVFIRLVAKFFGLLD